MAEPSLLSLPRPLRDCYVLVHRQAEVQQPPLLLSPRKVKPVKGDLPMENATWGCYPTAAALDGLIRWLNSKGELPGLSQLSHGSCMRCTPPARLQLRGLGCFHVVSDVFSM